MKKIAMAATAVFWFMFLMTVEAGAADKFATVDLSRVFSDYRKTREYDKVLGDKQNVYTTERDKKVDDIKQLQDKMNLLSDKEKEAKKTDLENKLKDLQELDRQKQTDLRKEQDGRMQEILKDIEDTVKQLAEKEGYTIVFNDRVLVYRSKDMDLTSKVIEALNKNYKK